MSNADSMPTVERQVSAAQAVENNGFAGLPTLPIVSARARAHLIVCIFLSVIYFSIREGKCVGSVGSPANKYKSTGYIAESLGSSVGIVSAGFSGEKRAG